MDEPRTHYQISLTARQAIGLFVALLLGLGLAFFFGLMAGLSGRAGSPVETASVGSEGPEGPEGADRPLRANAPTPAPPAAEAAPTTTVQLFEDASAGEAFPAPITPSATLEPTRVPAPPAAGPSAGRIWIQVASLQSRQDADALSRRISKRGYRTEIASVAGPKGKLYRVRVGPYSTEQAAKGAAAKLEKQERIRQTWIVRE